MQVSRSGFTSRWPGSQWPEATASGCGLSGIPAAQASALPAVDAIKKGRIKRPFHRFELDLASEILRDEIPVDQIPESRDIVGTPIAVIDIVGVLPYIAG